VLFLEPTQQNPFFLYFMNFADFGWALGNVSRCMHQVDKSYDILWCELGVILHRSSGRQKNLGESRRV